MAKKLNICITKGDLNSPPKLNGRALCRYVFIQRIGCTYQNHGYHDKSPITIRLRNYGIVLSQTICVIVKYFGKLLLKNIFSSYILPDF